MGLTECVCKICKMLGHLAKGKIFIKLDLREAYYRVRIKEVENCFQLPPWELSV